MSSTDAADGSTDSVDEESDVERIRWQSAERYARLDDDGLEVWRSSTGHRERRSYQR